MTPLHIVGRFGDPNSGAELEVLDLARRVRPYRPVHLWSDIPVHAAFKPMGVQWIRPYMRQMPYGGTLALGSVVVDTESWIRHAKPERVLVQYNVSHHMDLFAKIEHLRAATGVEPELSFVSELVKNSVGLPGPVIPSWIDLTSFLAVPLERPSGRPFTLGRLSRDFLGKHHPFDPRLYRMLASQGMRVRIMGGTCLAPFLTDVPGVELIPAGAEPAADFLATLDAFFYRLGSFVEAYGRVVLEAMAAGLPVVADVKGGYADAIIQGETGFLVQDQEQAFDRVSELQADGPLRLGIASRARQRAIELHGDEAVREMLQFYLR